MIPRAAWRGFSRSWRGCATASAAVRGTSSRTSSRSRPIPSRRPTRSPTPSPGAISTNLRDELGDLLFQVVYHAAMAEEARHFGFADVVRGISDKMVRRHPHVFGDESREKSAEQQTRDWERIKAAERGGPLRTRQRARWCDVRPASPDPRREAAESRRARRLRLAGRRGGDRQDRRGIPGTRRGPRFRRRDRSSPRNSAT